MLPVYLKCATQDLPDRVGPSDPNELVVQENSYTQTKPQLYLPNNFVTYWVYLIEEKAEAAGDDFFFWKEEDKITRINKRLISSLLEHYHHRQSQPGPE